MKHLLNLLAAIALLVWGTHLVRTGILRVFGANLRQLLPTQCWQQARAIVTHPRIAAAAQAAGFGVVRLSQPSVQSVAQAVASIESGA